MDWRSFMLGWIFGTIVTLLCVAFELFREIRKDMEYVRGFADGIKTSKGEMTDEGTKEQD